MCILVAKETTCQERHSCAAQQREIRKVRTEGGSNENKTSCRVWVADEKQLWELRQAHAQTRWRIHISSSLTGETSCRTKGRWTCFHSRHKWQWVIRQSGKCGQEEKPSRWQLHWMYTNIQHTLQEQKCKTKQKYGKHIWHLSRQTLCVYESITQPVSSA